MSGKALTTVLKTRAFMVRNKRIVWFASSAPIGMLRSRSDSCRVGIVEIEEVDVADIA
jgi:hypothetical protein